MFNIYSQLLVSHTTQISDEIYKLGRKSQTSDVILM